MALYLRNLKTGAIKTVEPDSKEFAAAKAERTDDGRFPLWEQTSAPDADPKNFGSDYEIANRSRWDAKIEDVTTDGVLQSGEHALGGPVGGFADLADGSGSGPAASSAPKSK